jgi:hypothetical protein
MPKVDTAARLARRAVNAQPRCRPAWLILARCYAAEGHYPEALVTLNAVPTPPLPRDERELLMVVPPPEPQRNTTPQVHRAHCLSRPRGNAAPGCCYRVRSVPVCRRVTPLQSSLTSGLCLLPRDPRPRPIPPFPRPSPSFPTQPLHPAPQGQAVSARPGGGARPGPRGWRHWWHVAAAGLPAWCGAAQQRARRLGALARPLSQPHHARRAGGGVRPAAGHCRRHRLGESPYRHASGGRTALLQSTSPPGIPCTCCRQHAWLRKPASCCQGLQRLSITLVCAIDHTSCPLA